MGSNICGIDFKESVADWKEAINLVGQPLLEKGCVDKQYIEAMVQNVIDNGPYIIMVPGFAMPHARPEYGALSNGVSVLKLDQPVLFPEEQDVSLIIAFAASDADAHIEVMSKLSEVLINDQIMDRLFATRSAEYILEVLQ